MIGEMSLCNIVLIDTKHASAQVTAMQSMYLGELGAEELLRPYRGVVPYHGDAVRHLKSGACVALQIEV